MNRSQLVRGIYKALSLEGTFHAARRGVGPLVRRVGRQRANRYGNRWLRKILKP